ncbi:MAG TPA: hypothetical protein VFH48_18885, partial [Chloroflexota bacterium]|nr:hypothetical protein [Chloroflexota bacterium]
MLLAAERGLLNPVASFVQNHHVLFSPRAGLAALRPSFAGPRELIDRLHAPTRLMPVRHSGRRFSRREVVDALAGRLSGPRAEQPLEMAAQTVRWMPADSRCG